MIVNLTRYTATPDLLLAGVVDLAGADRDKLVEAVTFNFAPSSLCIINRAIEVASLARGYSAAMICMNIPHPSDVWISWLITPLAANLRALGIVPLFSFVVKETVKTVSADGSKLFGTRFRHTGWVPAV